MVTICPTILIDDDIYLLKKNPKVIAPMESKSIYCIVWLTLKVISKRIFLRDGRIRIADLKTKAGILRRPVSKLVLLMSLLDP